MKRETLSEFITLTMTPEDRASLEYMAHEQGATLRGFIRRLIRNAASSIIPEQREAERRESYERTSRK